MLGSRRRNSTRAGNPVLSPQEVDRPSATGRSVTGVTADISALGKPKLEEKIYYYLGFLRPNNGPVTSVTEGPRDAGVTTSLERVLDALTANRYGGRITVISCSGPVTG